MQITKFAFRVVTIKSKHVGDFLEVSGDNNLVAFSTFDLEKYTTLDIETLRL